MVKRKAPPSPTPSPTPKRFREAGVEVVYLPPDALTIKSYGQDDQEELREAASAQLAHLMDQAAILRDPPPSYVMVLSSRVSLTIKCSQQPTGRGKGKGKGAAKGKGKATKQQVDDEPDWLPGWEFFHERAPGRARSKAIQPQLDYIERMKKGWRPTGRKKMGMPEEWFVRHVSSPLFSSR